MFFRCRNRLSVFFVFLIRYFGYFFILFYKIFWICNFINLKLQFLVPFSQKMENKIKIVKKRKTSTSTIRNPLNLIIHLIQGEEKKPLITTSSILNKIQTSLFYKWYISDGECMIGKSLNNPYQLLQGIALMFQEEFMGTPYLGVSITIFFLCMCAGFSSLTNPQRRLARHPI